MYNANGWTGWNGSWDTYALRNGIVCKPGTYIKGADGPAALPIADQANSGGPQGPPAPAD
jgi:hypothetical protein